MQNLRSEVCQLGCLLEVELTDGLRVLHDARVVIMHAVNVGPYLDFLCGEGSTYERSRKVATAAEQIVHFSVGVTADKALRDIHLIALVLLHYGSELLFDVV